MYCPNNTGYIVERARTDECNEAMPYASSIDTKPGKQAHI